MELTPNSVSLGTQFYIYLRADSFLASTHRFNFALDLGVLATGK